MKQKTIEGPTLREFSSAETSLIGAKITSENIQDLASWCGGVATATVGVSGEAYHTRIFLKGENFFVGEYILKDRRGNIYGAKASIVEAISGAE